MLLLLSNKAIVLLVLLLLWRLMLSKESASPGAADCSVEGKEVEE